jgi:hypothetical protein
VLVLGTESFLCCFTSAMIFFVRSQICSVRAVWICSLAFDSGAALGSPVPRIDLANGPARVFVSYRGSAHPAWFSTEQVHRFQSPLQGLDFLVVSHLSVCSHRCCQDLSFPKVVGLPLLGFCHHPHARVTPVS